MNTDEVKFKLDITKGINAFSNEDVIENTRILFNTLGYESTRSIELGPDYFIKSNNFNSEKAKVNDWLNANMIFQITTDELTSINTLFRPNFEKDLYQSFLFYAVELKPNHYTRTDLARITREINKPLPMPVIVLFKMDNLLNLAVIERRRHKRDISKDVLEKVTLIRNIDISEPHRAHIEILYNLSLPYLIAKYKFHNFEGLHKAWKETLDISELNKQFYKELSNWYFWAMHVTEFPDDVEKDRDKRNAINLIRLITRLIFVWFIKEKKLVPEELFDEDTIRDIINFTDKTDSTYYKAILQNLFFATLNLEMNKDKPGSRKFIERNDGFHSQQYFVPAYRYKRFFKDPEKVLTLFENIPFLNGGLFENLDYRIEEEKKEIRIDCFSDKEGNETRLKVPDYLFFSGERRVDLSDSYGDKKKKSERVRGIFRIFNNYKFTIEENTPVEVEVALDPELLGRVFENLLASYNPETHTTARKATGSFYTPREIVNYMVDESLIAYLEQLMKDKIPGLKEMDDLDELLREVLSYTEKTHPFTTEEEIDVIIEAISNVKILDPACGSGAYPMGILHKIVYLLSKIDPENQKWREIQKQKAIQETEEAYKIGDQHERQQRLLEIDDAFENNASDYGRKLYLIENCIYGVDIQTIAVQIAKLRVFISLVIDQEVDPNKINLNIRPLPNLETKFVAANTLIGLEKPKQRSLRNPQIDKLETELKKVRRDHFNARTRSEKNRLRKLDEKLRHKIAELLINDHWKDTVAHQISSWNPYNQIESSSFFDPEWMFGIIGGFNIVIGNPPYIKEYTYRQAFDGLRNSDYYKGKMDIWYMFACEGIDFLKSNGILAFIAQNNWVTSYGASILRNKIIEDTQIINLVDFGDFKIFETTGIQTMIMIFRKDEQSDSYNIDYRKLNYSNSVQFPDILEILSKSNNEHVVYLNPSLVRKDFVDKVITFGDKKSEYILNKIAKQGKYCFDDKTEVAQGIVFPQDFLNRKNQKILGNKFKIGQGIFVLNDTEKNSLQLTKNELEIIKPEYTTEELLKYYANPKNRHWVIYTDSSFKGTEKIKKYPSIKKHLDQFVKIITSDNKPYGLHRARDERFFKGDKIISLRKCVEPTFTYTDFDCYVSATFYIIKTDRFDLKYLTGLLNSKLIVFWLKHRGKMQGNNYQVDKEPLLNIPIIKPSDDLQKPIIFLVEKILEEKENNINTDISKYVDEIDKHIYTLYRLDDEEIITIENQIS